MGCLRLAYSLVVSLLTAAFFTVFGAVAGAILSVILSSHESAIASGMASPLDMLAANPTGVLIGGGIGAVIGLVGIVRAMQRASNINWLKSNGRRISATVTEIQTKWEHRQVPYSTGQGTQYRSESYKYYVIVARWVDPQTRQAYTFRSERRAFYPKKYAVGSSISVLIDPANPQRSLVEV